MIQKSQGETADSENLSCILRTLRLAIYCYLAPRQQLDHLHVGVIEAYTGKVAQVRKTCLELWSELAQDFDLNVHTCRWTYFWQILRLKSGNWYLLCTPYCSQNGPAVEAMFQNVGNGADDYLWYRPPHLRATVLHVFEKQLWQQPWSRVISSSTNKEDSEYSSNESKVLCDRINEEIGYS